MLLVLLCVAIFCGTIQGFTHEQANNYIDDVLSDRFAEEAQYNRLDPYRLDNIVVPLNYSGRPRGSAVLSKGIIINLSKAKRGGDCTLPTWQYKNVTFTCFLQFDHLRINYTANVTYDNVNLIFYPHIHIKGTNITIQVTSSAEDDVPNLSVLYVNRIGNMTVTAEMVSIGDIAAIISPPIREALVAKSVINLHKAIGGRFKTSLAYSIYKTPLGFDS